MIIWIHESLVPVFSLSVLVQISFLVPFLVFFIPIRVIEGYFRVPASRMLVCLDRQFCRLSMSSQSSSLDGYRIAGDYWGRFKALSRSIVFFPDPQQFFEVPRSKNFYLNNENRHLKSHCALFFARGSYQRAERTWEQVNGMSRSFLWTTVGDCLQKDFQLGRSGSFVTSQDHMLWYSKIIPNGTKNKGQDCKLSKLSAVAIRSQISLFDIVKVFLWPTFQFWALSNCYLSS